MAIHISMPPANETGIVTLPGDARLVVDHIAKPRIAIGAMEPWAGLISELARRTNVCCKISGMVTEADIALVRG